MNFRAPFSFCQFLEHFPISNSKCVSLHVRTVAQPGSPKNNLKLVRLTWDGLFYRVYSAGYMEAPDLASVGFQNSLKLLETDPEDEIQITHAVQYTSLKAKKPVRDNGAI